MTVDVRITPETDIQATLNERRRAGRRPAAQELLPLLRAPAEGEEVPEDLLSLLKNAGELPIHVDPIAPARGIAIGVALSVPIWSAIGGLVYILLK
jgi:hypothetical protein